MEIQVNGEARQVPANLTATGLIESMGLAGKRIAMEINREIIPRGQHAEYHITGL